MESRIANHSGNLAYRSRLYEQRQVSNKRGSFHGAMMKAVIDRFEGSLAVLLVGDSEEKLVVPRSTLPKGAKAGHWLQVEIRNGQLQSATLDEAETERMRQRIAEKLERLRRGEHRSG
jgi:hypothetical protein